MSNISCQMYLKNETQNQAPDKPERLRYYNLGQCLR